MPVSLASRLAVVLSDESHVSRLTWAQPTFQPTLSVVSTAGPPTVQTCPNDVGPYRAKTARNLHLSGVPLIGDKVVYFSASHKRWIPSIITDVGDA